MNSYGKHSKLKHDQRVGAKERKIYIYTGDINLQHTRVPEAPTRRKPSDPNAMANEPKGIR